MERPPRAINKLGFLVHPGFLRDPATDGEPVWKERIKRYQKWDSLLGSYVEKARQLGPDEILIVMLHATPSELLSDFKLRKAYTQPLREIKRILGPRMIALSGDHDITDPRSYQVARDIAERRGYIFNASVFSEAYGETLEVCVAEASNLANETLGLSNRTVLRRELTEDPKGVVNFEIFKNLQFEE